MYDFAVSTAVWVGFKRKNWKKREGKEKENEGRKDGRKGESQIHIPREKNAN
jgi:hypothetical protein